MPDQTPTAAPLVRCPNMCCAGKVQHYPDASRALYDMVTCPDCHGKGEVTPERATQILKSM